MSVWTEEAIDGLRDSIRNGVGTLSGNADALLAAQLRDPAGRLALAREIAEADTRALLDAAAEAGVRVEVHGGTDRADRDACQGRERFNTTGTLRCSCGFKSHPICEPGTVLRMPEVKP